MLTRRDFAITGLGAFALTKGGTRLFGATGSAAPAAPEGADIRRVGIRPNGAYWGAGGEQIDLLSGNLNYSIQLITSVSRSLAVAVRCSYNSQLWRKDGATARLLGSDAGCGFGWKAQIGCIVPQTSAGKVQGYTFVDGGGAEHALQASGSVWVSAHGLFLTWDPAAATLKLPDGTVWVFGCVSAPGEVDAGTLYPTAIRDTNGNQVLVRYLTGNGAHTINSSGRISEIQDARAVTGAAGRRTYSFVHDSGAAPKLLSISSLVGTEENYLFAYSTQQLASPFDKNSSLGNTSVLQSITMASGIKQTFEYNGSGELVSTQVGHGGVVSWSHATFSFDDGRSIREVATRAAQAGTGDPKDVFQFQRDAGDRKLKGHSGMTLNEPGSAEKYWSFVSDATSPDFGLLTTTEERTTGHKVLRSLGVTWARTAEGIAYAGAVVHTLDPGTAHAAASRTEHVVDSYGNMLEHRKYEYGNASTPVRTVRNTFLSDPAYLNSHIRNRLVTSSVSDGSTTTTLVQNQYDTTGLVGRAGLSEHDTTNFGTGATVRGNVTESVAGGVYRKVQYDVTGTASQVQDGNGYQASVIPASGTNNTRVGTVTPNGNPGLGVQGSFDSVGRPLASIGPNGATAGRSYDAFGRVAAVTNPDGATASIRYGVSPTTKEVTANGRSRKTTYDGFGRPLKVEGSDASGAHWVVDYQYAASAGSPVGRVKAVSLAHAPGAAPQWVTYKWDDLGRIAARDLPGSGGTTTYSYAGNSSTVVDPAGRSKKLVHSATGKITQVVQPHAETGSDLVTSYAWNALGKLTGVVMPRPEGTQTRSFDYDSGGRTVARAHAETGRKALSYNVDGKLAGRVDAKGQKTVYARDAYKRVVAVDRHDATGNRLAGQSTTHYHDTNPLDATYSKNAQGRLAAVQWGDAGSIPGLFTEMFTYTVAGRVTGKRVRITRGTSSATIELTCGYDAEGRLVSMVYPGGGPSLKYAYDGFGRLSGLSSGGTVLVKGVTFTPKGQIASIQHQTGSDGQFVTERRTYDERNRLTRITAVPVDASAHTVPSMDVEYTYRAGDGLVGSETDHVSGTRHSYDYDSHGRLTSASASDGSWAGAWTYDGFGNRVAQKTVKGNGPVHATAHDPATNHMQSAGTVYDANGNLIKLPWVDLEYDVENRLAKATSGVNGTELYGYDPANRRVWRRTAAGSEEVYLYAPTTGQRLATFALNTDAHGALSLTLVDTNVYFGGRLVQSRGDGVLADRLGAVRGRGNAAKAAVATKYLPFGEELVPTAEDTDKFGRYVRDSVSGLDYAEQRYYSSAAGRFVTPDPYEGSVRLGDPDSWNRYSFVKNNPVNFVDPNGLSVQNDVIGCAGGVGGVILLGAVDAGTGGAGAVGTAALTVSAAGSIAMGCPTVAILVTNAFLSGYNNYVASNIGASTVPLAPLPEPPAVAGNLATAGGLVASTVSMGNSTAITIGANVDSAVGVLSGVQGVATSTSTVQTASNVAGVASGITTLDGNININEWLPTIPPPPAPPVPDPNLDAQYSVVVVATPDPIPYDPSVVDTQLNLPDPSASDGGDSSDTPPPDSGGDDWGGS